MSKNRTEQPNMRLCISLGGDADTMGAITGAIAGAYYHQIPYDLYEFGINKLPGNNLEAFEGKDLPDDILDIINKFDYTYAREVSFRWRNPDYDAECLIRKVKSGEMFI